LENGFTSLNEDCSVGTRNGATVEITA